MRFNAEREKAKYSIKLLCNGFQGIPMGNALALVAEGELDMKLPNESPAGDQVGGRPAGR